jgi:hypothetical protein
MPEYTLRLRPDAPIKGVRRVAAIRGGYTDSRSLKIGDEIPEIGGGTPTLLLLHGVAAWTIDIIDTDGLVHCLPRPTELG